MNTTRWNPTTNGAIHLGHIYCLLVNERFAHESGGKFYIRFDDTDQAVTIEMEHPERTVEIEKRQREDVEWLGIPVDGWQTQSDILDDVHKEMKKYINKYTMFPDPYPHIMPISIRMGTTWIPYPYTPFQTAERVIMDHMLGITHVIRGEDFLTEYSLYRYFCDVFERPHPKFICLPRLTDKYGRDVSKTNGGYTITEFRNNGYTSGYIKRMLELACLNWPNNGWGLHNLKQNPRLEI